MHVIPGASTPTSLAPKQNDARFMPVEASNRRLTRDTEFATGRRRSRSYFGNRRFTSQPQSIFRFA